MSLSLGSIVSVGGGSSGGGAGGGSGIQVIDPGGNTGPTVTFVGANGISVTSPSANIVLIDGSALSGLIGSSSASGQCYSQTFTNVTSVTLNHNLNTTEIVINVFDELNNLIIPDNVSISDVNNVVVTFNRPQSGTAVILACGAGGGTASQSGVIGVNGIQVHQIDGNFVVDGSALSGVAAASGQCYSEDFSSVTTTTITHNLGTTEIVVNIFDANGNLIIPDNVAVLGINSMSISFNRPQDGKVVVLGCGGTSTSSSQSGVIGVNGIDVHQIGGNFVVDAVSLSGIIPLKYAASFTGTSGIITHSLGTLDVLVQVYDKSSGGARKVIPDDIIIENLNEVSVIFNKPVSNYRVVII